MFVNCPRCFYLDRRLGIGRPSGPAFTLNTAVDALLKKEFDVYRANGEPHPIMTASGIAAIPFSPPDLDIWRENFKGVQTLHAPTNLRITGAIDDVWVNAEGTLLVVDYKSTSTEKTITFDDPWKQAYKRQMEIYQWLLRQNGFAVSDTGYFVYVNAGKNRDGFHNRLDFTARLIPYIGNASWVAETLIAAHSCLRARAIPQITDGCEWCAYTEASKIA